MDVDPAAAPVLAGTVWAWGQGRYGQLANGSTQAKTTPVHVSNLSGVTAISANGGMHNLGIKSDGTLWAWGYNKYGQLGDGTTTNRSTPVQVSGVANPVAISAGGDHSLDVKTDGTLLAWGNNAYGQLGDGTTTNRLTPVAVKNLNNVT